MTYRTSAKQRVTIWLLGQPQQRFLWRRVLTLALPVVGENLLQTMMGIIDTILVARLGAAQLAGVGTALQSVFFLFSILTAIATGASVLIAQAVGAGDRARASLLAKQALIGSVGLALPVSVAGVALAVPAVRIYGVSPAVATFGGLYTQITMATSLVLIVMFIAGAILRGAGDTRTPMVVTLLSNVINAVAAYALIFGHFGLPALGVAGSAWAAVIGRVIGAILLLGVLVRRRRAVTIYGWPDWRPRLAIWREILALGMPAATEQILTTIAFSGLTAIVAHLGTTALAAQRITINVLLLSFMPGLGCAIAATIMVGQSVGAGKISEGVAATGIAARLAIVWMSTLGVVFVVLGTPLMRAFTTDPQVIGMGVGCLVAIAIAQPAWALQDVLAGGLRGAGNTIFPMVANTSTLWLAVILAFIGVTWAHGDLTWTWISFTLATPVAALVIGWRFRVWVRVAQPMRRASPTSQAT